MDLRASLLTLALCLGLLIWVRWDQQSYPINYDWHEILVDEETGAKIEPRQVVDLGKIIRESESYINQTNAVQRLFERVHQTILADGFHQHDTYSDPRDLALSGWPVSAPPKCDQQLAWINEQLRLNPDYLLLEGRLGRELTALLDSYGKPESGTYSGISSWPGSYSLCQRTALDGGEIKTRYCAASFRFKSWPANERAVPKSRIKMGICLPETCDTSSFKRNKAQIESLAKLELNSFYKENLIFEGLYCLPDERSPLRQIPRAGWILIGCCGVWLIALTFATIKHLKSIGQLREAVERSQQPDLKDNTAAHCERTPIRSRASDEIWKSLSIVNSWQEFWADSFSAALEARAESGRGVRNDMRSMNCVRVLMTLSVVYGHCWFTTFSLARSVQLRLDMNSLDWAHLIFSFGRNVDGFFLFFGLLMAHNSLKKFTPSQLGQPQVWLAINANILSRVWPMYALTHYFARFIAPYLAAGPWWDYGTYTYSITSLCRQDSWITSLPHLGHFGRVQLNTCVPPAWFVVSYAQLALFMPLVTYAICKLPNHFARLLLVAFGFFITGLQLVLKINQQTSLRPEAFVMYGGFLPTLLEKYESTGTMSTLSRVGCVMCGCYLGYLLREYELGHIKQWPSWLLSEATLPLTVLVHLVVFVLPVVGKLLMEGREHEATSTHFVLGFMGTMILWLVCLSIETIWCFTLKGSSALVRFMSSSFWTRCNKLGLCILLTHWHVMVYGLSHYEEAAPHGFLAEIWPLFCYTLVATIPISLLLHITFEAPVAKVFKVMVSGLQKRVSRRTNVNGLSNRVKKLD